MKKNILVLGAGFGGLRAALSLDSNLKKSKLRSKYQVTLVDRNVNHVYTPLLYLVAAPKTESKNLDIHKAAWPFNKILDGTDIKFVQGEVVELDLMHGDIHLADGRKLRCNYLALAPGSETNYFGIPGLEQYSLPLKTKNEAEKISSTVYEALEKDPSARIVVGGGGPTGIEISAEIKYRYPRSRVSLIEAAPTLMPGFSPAIVQPAEKRLRKLGVEVILSEPIAEATPKKVISKNKMEVSYDVLIWTGGVKAPGLLAGLPIKLESRGRVEVAENMFCLPEAPDLKLGPMIYALGDSVCMYDPETGKPLPGVAPSAIEQGEIVAQNITNDIKREERLTSTKKHLIYKHKDRPYVLIVGGRWGIAKLFGNFTIRGWAAWALARLVELDYKFSLRK